MTGRILLVCVGLLTSCDRTEPAPTPAPVTAPSTPAAPREPKITPLPDCAGVETALPAAKPEDWLAAARREPENPDLVAKVGDTGIPRSASEAIVALKIEKYVSRKREPPPAALDRYRSSTASRLVAHEILRQEAATLGVEADAAAIDRRTARQRVGIADYPEHLRRRGETEASLRDMLLAELREVAIIEKDAPIEIAEPQLVAQYCRDRDAWKNDREYRVVSHLAFAKPDMAAAAIEKIKGGTAIEDIAASDPNLVFEAHQLVAHSDNEFSRAAYAAPVDVPAIVEIGGTAYVVVVERTIPAGSLSRELVFDALRDDARQHELRKRRVELRARLLVKYPVIAYGVPEMPASPDPEPD